MKKLTAGIFTALLGLVTVNAANAAIPSTNYVDSKINDVTTAYQSADTSIRNDFAAADTALGTRIDGVETAYKSADSALDTRVTDLETTVGEGTMVVATETQADVIAAINALDAKTNGIATSDNLEKLQATVTEHTNSLNVLNGTGEGSVAKAETDAVATAKDYADSLAANYDAAGAAATAETNAKAYADGLAGNYDAAGSAAAAQEAAESYADSLATNYDAAGAAATAETNAKAYADGLAGNYDTKGSAAAAQEAAESYAAEGLALKVDIAQGAEKANHVVITDTSGNVTTSATIEQTQVNGLSDALAAKLPVTAANNADGKYVLTATALNGTITYAWEDISREVSEEE